MRSYRTSYAIKTGKFQEFLPQRSSKVYKYPNLTHLAIELKSYIKIPLKFLILTQDCRYHTLAVGSRGIIGATTDSRSHKFFNQNFLSQALNFHVSIDCKLRFEKLDKKLHVVSEPKRLIYISFNHLQCENYFIDKTLTVNRSEIQEEYFFARSTRYKLRVPRAVIRSPCK